MDQGTCFRLKISRHSPAPKKIAATTESTLPERAVSGLRAGDWVEVRSWEEISNTLDEQGRLDALPFMPEMLQYCGRKFQVYKSAHKACDTIEQSGNRRMTEAVHLEGLRCDGTAHGGCQARCLLYWKTAWLKCERGSQPKEYFTEKTGQSRNTFNDKKTHCELYNLSRATRLQAVEGDTTEELYRCQATDLLRATTPMRWWDGWQYAKDLISRNVRVRDFVRYVLIAGFNAIMRLPSRLNERLIRVLAFVASQERQQSPYQICNRQSPTISRNLREYTKFFLTHYTLPRTFVRHVTNIMLRLFRPLSTRLHPYPYVRGHAQGKTPNAVLNLQVGELVQVRPLEEIEHTINKERRNRGLKIETEMARYCGGVYRVLARVEKIINEKNGRMMHLYNDCVILEGVTCSGCVSQNRLFCPRSIYPYWREIWLKRVNNENAEQSKFQSENIANLN